MERINYALLQTTSKTSCSLQQIPPNSFFFEIPILRSAPKEVVGAMLDKPVNAAQIESGPKGVPAIVAESSKDKKLTAN